MPDVVLGETDEAYARVFDAMYSARAASGIVRNLYAQAMGDLYPWDVDPAGSADWPLMGSMVGALRMHPNQQLVDLGCGSGGVGLWLARALGVAMTGIDISALALRLAADRAPAFQIPDTRAEFAVGLRTATGLPDQYAHGLVCVDALGKRVQRPAVLAEIRRVLKPGGRAVLTSSRSRTVRAPTWQEDAAQAGLVLEAGYERPHEPQMWSRLYGLWIRHEAELRRELGDEQTDSMLHEARAHAPMLGNRQALVVTLRRPLNDASPAARRDPACPVVLPSTEPDRGGRRSPLFLPMPDVR
ncbi:methyltransferase type 11 [Streptomyces zinciresistens K42]|uniref:Methyltransferase type 11 n=1 Tax=Streptomyces zinciresistens K42 TaxID=700597 RepID=G2GAW5_9ACTN|nr:class I SAM-dependent methyltransferase [Streptomyces zinciresistens]EGX59356.1 methyltransferase type 11 [Streptomyces zinciresistens K42]